MKKGTWSNFILIIILLIGLSLLLYPSFSEYWNSFHQTRVIASYTEQVAKLDNSHYEKIWADAITYNQDLLQKQSKLSLTDEELEVYNNTLNFANDGVMGYIEIPSIKCSLPVYHGIDDSVLQIGIGHLDWTSLPTGGEGTHCALSGHRGLPSAKLFTNLDQMREGDLFMLQILDKLLTYEVDQILIVEPYEVNSLKIEEGKDLCTLVTCTPYGVNSHRLLVRGHRVANEIEAEIIRVTNDAIQVEPLLVAPVVAAPILLGLLVVLFASGKKKTR